ncbi:MAG: hypothetical protein LBQ57_03415 [Spirochaetales bacterium]|jgi:hypothetical protein|nr:hypothetical protein [Spirochaetales bacterium]
MGRLQTLIFYSGAVWETGRFFFLFQIVSAAVNPQANPLVSLLILWISSGQLCTALLFFLGGYMPERFFCLRKITAVFTFMGILPPIAALLGQGLFVRVLPQAMRISPGFVIPAFIISIDALFLVFLLSHREDT